MAGADVEEDEFIGPLLLVASRDFNGITGVAQVDEVDTLDDADVLDVEAGDDANLEHLFGPQLPRLTVLTKT